jgi:arylsulfatase A-like enzyme
MVEKHGTRRDFLRRSGSLAATAFAGRFLLAGERHAAARPNIVIILADDQGYGETGYYGHPHVRTPVLDEMAAGGLQLDRFYAAAPVCSPTRAGILTGRHPNRSGVFAPNYSTRPEEITIAQILKQAGYRTGHFGKWHVGAVKAASPTNPRRMGFDEYLSHDNFFELDPPLSRNGADPVIHKGESSWIVVEAASEFVRKVHEEGKPFFVCLWFGSPHSPYRGLPEDVATYEAVKSEEQRHRFAEISAMDRAIGRFRSMLKELGAAENTLLWYSSDNGTPIPKNVDPHNGGFRGNKGSLYEGGLRVPAVIEWPAVIREHRVSAVPCVSSDIFPTLLDLTGLSSPDPNRPIDGISLRRLVVADSMKERPQPIGFWKYNAGAERKNERWMSPELTRGTTPTTRNPAIDFRNFKHPVAKTDDFGGWAAWTGTRYRLHVNNRKGIIETELYDLSVDPGEESNIAARRGDIVKRMTAELQEWQRSVERSLSGADYR